MSVYFRPEFRLRESVCDCPAAMEQEIAISDVASSILSKKELTAMRCERVAFLRHNGIAD